MLTYILEVTMCWLIFYAIFFVALRKLTFFRVNRWYLLLSLLSGIIIPLLKNVDLNLYQEDVAEIAPIVYVIKDAPAQIATSVAEQTTDWNIITSYLLLSIYILGFSFFVFRFIKGLLTIRHLYRTGKSAKKDSFTLITTRKDHLPFSFFKFVFISGATPLKEEYNQIIKHEISHVKGWHSLDIILIELINIIWWFNPFIYLYKTAIRQTHEYLADHAVLQNTSRKKYGTLLLKQSLSGIQIALTHQFFHSHIKKRINMMYQKKSGQSAWLKYSLALPVLVLLFIVFSGYNNGNYTSTQFGQDINFHCDGVKGSIFPAKIYVNEPTTVPSQQIGLYTKYPDHFRELIFNYNPKKNFVVIIDGKLIQKNLRSYIHPDRDIQSAELTIYSPEFAMDQFGSIARHGAVEFKNIHQEGIQSRIIITATSPLGDDIIRQLEEAYRETPNYPGEVNIQKVLLLYNSLRVKYKEELADLRKLFISFLNSKNIEYRLNDRHQIEGLSLKEDNGSTTDQSNIPLVLYEGKVVEFPSMEAAAQYRKRFTGVEIISGDQCYKQFGSIAKNRQTVFNHIRVDGYLLRTNEEESFVYHNGEQWMHRYTSPSSGKFTIIIRDGSFKEIWEKDYYKSGKTIETPVSDYTTPEGLFQISIVSSFSGRLDGLQIQLEKSKKSKTEDRSPSSKTFGLKGDQFNSDPEYLNQTIEKILFNKDTVPQNDQNVHFKNYQKQKIEEDNVTYKNALILLDGKEIGRGFDMMPDFEEIEIGRIEVLGDDHAIQQYGEKGREGVILLTSKELDQQPLFILDGTFKIRSVNRPFNLEPDDIKKVEVIKGEKALEQYGDEGSNGVVLITTKENIFGEETNPNQKSGPQTEKKRDRRKKSLENKLLIIDNQNHGIKNLNEIKIEEFLSLDDIHTITVYSDKKAIDKFGEDGKDGVIEISTKSFTIDNNKREGSAHTLSGKDLNNQSQQLLTLFEGELIEFRDLNSLFEKKKNYNGIEIYQTEKSILNFIKKGPKPSFKKSRKFKKLFDEHSYSTVFNHFNSQYLQETITDHYTVKIPQVKNGKLKLEYFSNKKEEVDFIISPNAGEKVINRFSKQKGNHVIVLEISDLPETGFVISFYPKFMGGGFDSKAYRLAGSQLISDLQALNEWKGEHIENVQQIKYDTVVSYDPVTYTERMQIVRRLPNDQNAMSNTNNSEYTIFDTFVVFNPEDYTEQFFVLPQPDTIVQQSFDHKENSIKTTTIISAHSFGEDGKPYTKYDTSVVSKPSSEYFDEMSEESRVNWAVVQNVISYRNNNQEDSTEDLKVRAEGITLTAFLNETNQLEVRYLSDIEGDVTFYIHDLSGKLVDKKTIVHQNRSSEVFFPVKDHLARLAVITAAQEDKISSVKVIIP